MWMSECIVVVDRNNADANTVADIAAAVGEIGAVGFVNESQYVIGASVPAHELPTVHAMDGVAYVRCVFSYFCGMQPAKAA
jgi:hypothetical protein